MPADSSGTRNKRRQRMGKDPLASLGFGDTPSENSGAPHNSEKEVDQQRNDTDHDHSEGSYDRSPSETYSSEQDSEQEVSTSYGDTPQNKPQPNSRNAGTPAKKRVSFVLPLDLVEQARDAAHWVPGATITALVEQGLNSEIERLQDEHNDGRRFPQRDAPLKRGRPVSR